jgi:hypothetical protein
MYSPDIKDISPMNRTESAAIDQEGLVDHTNPPQDIVESNPVATGESDSTPPPAAAPAPAGAVNCSAIVKPYSASTKLSANYTIGSLCNGGVPANQGGEWTQDIIICGLRSLAMNIIEPLRAKYSSKGFVINSCFRPNNTKSQHGQGRAVDIGFKPSGGKLTKKEYYDIAVEIKNSTLPFDQMLLEYRGNDSYWIHISHVPGGPQRRVVSTFVNDKNYPVGRYPSGLHLVT